MQNALSGGETDTFYGRFYRQLRLELDEKAGTREYIVKQLQQYWGSIDGITQNTSLVDAYDIYRYGIDSYGNMYCLYKWYNSRPDMVSAVMAQGGFSYRYMQNTPGELWIRLKDHPLAFPAFSGRYPNVYMGDELRHIAFVNLFNLYKRDNRGNISCDPKGNAVQEYDTYTHPVAAGRAQCIYDFEFTKNRQDITFVTKMLGVSRLSAPDYDTSKYRYYAYTLSDESPDVQCYQNSWLVHCRPLQDTLTSDSQSREVLRLYIPAGETDYFMSGDDRLCNSRLSDVQCLTGEGRTLYQYIGSYLQGDSSIYHAYAEKNVRYNEISDVVREISGTGYVKIFPVINGIYQEANCIRGRLSESSALSVTGSDVCIAYDEQNSIINFVAQTVLPPDTRLLTESGSIELSANALGPAIGDPLNIDINSHDIFSTNVTLFRKRVLTKRLYDAINMDSRYTFNVNADMSYFPSYPGAAGLKKLWTYSGFYDRFSVELLGTAKDISREISYVNPCPDPYMDADTILSDFVHARVYQDYWGYLDETL